MKRYSLFRIDFSITDSLKIVRKSVLIYETIIFAPGYVYLTNSPLTALDFASRRFTADECSANSRMLVVFEIMIDTVDVQDDEDEKNMPINHRKRRKMFSFFGEH